MLKIISPQNHDILTIYPNHDPIMVCRINALFQCYHAYPEIARFYYSDTGGLLCALGGSIFVSGDIDGEELLGFAKTFGFRSISAASGEWESSFAGCKAITTPVMTYQGIMPLQISNILIERNPQRRSVYEILCCDADFAAGSDPLHWISDIATRQRLGCARLYTIGNLATAGVYFISSQVGIIASVATRPEARGQGLASTLIRFITAELISEGIEPAVICGNLSLEKFYSSLGFKTIYSHSHILLQ